MVPRKSKGLHQSKLVDYGFRGARLASGNDEIVLSVPRGVATQPEEMHRKPEQSSYSEAGPRLRQRGQAMTEYIIIVALIAIAAIAVVTIFGDNIRALFASSAESLRGEHKSVEDMGATETTDGQVKRDLKNFHEAP